MGTATTPTKRWYHWYSPDDTPEERKLVLKLDLLIVPYAFIVYWVKYIDQGNISKSITRSYHHLVLNGPFQTMHICQECPKILASMGTN